MTERRYGEMTVPELKVLAREASIQGRSKMRRQELIEALRRHDAEACGHGILDDAGRCSSCGEDLGEVMQILDAEEAEAIFTAEDEDPEFDPEPGGHGEPLAAEVEARDAAWTSYIAAWNRQSQRPSRTARRRLHRTRKALPRALRRAERRASVRAVRNMRKVLADFRQNGVDSLLGAA